MRSHANPRQETLERTADLLRKSGFYLLDLQTFRPRSFDLLGRRDSLLLLIKVLKNVDALGEEGAASLQNIAWMMRGFPLLVGTTSGSQPLENGVVYNRYGLCIMTFETMEDYLINGVPPFLFSSPGGIFARIDGRRLKALREEHLVSLGAVADAVGVSRRTIQLYEEGAGAEVEVVERLERFFGAPLATPINPFGDRGSGRARETSESEPGQEETTDRMTESVVAELGGQGWRVRLVSRGPFDALARPEHHAAELLVMGVGDLENAARRARWLHDIARVAEGWSLFVVPELRSHESIEGTPLVAVNELKRRRDPESLFELIEERSDW